MDHVELMAQEAESASSLGGSAGAALSYVAHRLNEIDKRFERIEEKLEYLAERDRMGDADG